MKIQYNQKSIISAEEFGYENYPIPADVLGKKARSKYDEDIATTTLRKWDYSYERISEVLKEVSGLGSHSNKRERNNLRAYAVWSNIYLTVISKLFKTVRSKLEQDYEIVFEPWMLRTDKDLFIYREPNSKAIIKLSEGHTIKKPPIPSIVLESTSEVDLEEIVKNTKEYITKNWNLPKQKE